MRYRKLTCLVVVLLLQLTALFKALGPGELILGIHATLGVWVSPWIAVLIVAVECGSACWLWMRPSSAWALRLVTAMFLVFSSYHVYNILFGAFSSCGCTGGLWLEVLGERPSPWIEALLAGIPTLLLLGVWSLPKVPKHGARPFAVTVPA